MTAVAMPAVQTSATRLSAPDLLKHSERLARLELVTAELIEAIDKGQLERVRPLMQAAYHAAAQARVEAERLAEDYGQLVSSLVSPQSELETKLLANVVAAKAAGR